jgi:hypothetical protein
MQPIVPSTTPGSVAATVCVAPEVRRGRLPRQAEIENLDLPIVEQEDVVGFEIR